MNPKRCALYPGTFDPITHGHTDLVRRAAGIFERVVVAIAANPNKAPMFPLEKRVEMVRKVCDAMGISNVEVIGYRGLTVEVAREHGCGVVMRGLRAVSDFEFEFQLANMSRHLSREVETVFLFPWALAFQKLGLFAFVEMLVFIAILMVGYLYLLKKGALKWQ